MFNDSPAAEVRTEGIKARATAVLATPVYQSGGKAVTLESFLYDIVHGHEQVKLVTPQETVLRVLQMLQTLGSNGVGRESSRIRTSYFSLEHLRDNFLDFPEPQQTEVKEGLTLALARYRSLADAMGIPLDREPSRSAARG